MSDSGTSLCGRTGIRAEETMSYGIALGCAVGTPSCRFRQRRMALTTTWHMVSSVLMCWKLQRTPCRGRQRLAEEGGIQRHELLAGRTSPRGPSHAIDPRLSWLAHQEILRRASKPTLNPSAQSAQTRPQSRKAKFEMGKNQGSLLPGRPRKNQIAPLSEFPAGRRKFS